MTTSPLYPEITVQLTEDDGNAFYVLGKCRKAMKHARINQKKIDAFTKEATSGDYDHLLSTCIMYFNVE